VERHGTTRRKGIGQNAGLERLLQPRCCAKLFISFLYTRMEGKKEIGAGTGHYMVVQMEHEQVGPYF
jgi:hypothetical protein